MDLSALVSSLQSTLGRLGLKPAFGNLKPSGIVSVLVLLFGMLFATVEAANRLEFTQVWDIVSMFIKFGGEILLGGVILVIGFWLANLVYHAISRASGEQTTGLARIARIVNLAFGLTLGAVAIALSFGLGGREAAGKQMEHSLSRFRKGQ